MRFGFVITLLLTLAGTAAAQTAQRFQVDVGTSIVRFGSINPSRGFDEVELAAKYDTRAPRLPLPHWTEAGLSVRLGYRTSQAFSLEAEAGFFPKYAGGSFVPVATNQYDQFRGQGKLLVLVGPKVGRQRGNVGVFGKLRAGLLHFGGFPMIQTVDRSTKASVIATIGDDNSATFGVVDIGGVFEFTTHARFVLRADAGDLIVLYRPSPIDFNPGFVRHNLQIGASIGMRF